MNTIAAISSPLGAGGIGIVRVSGHDALKIADTVFNFASQSPSEWKPLYLNFGTFDSGDFSDKGYAVYFPAAKSFTGEETVEFYLHGGVRIMTGALDALLSRGAVLADKGEFTKRAFLNGRLSLADAEGVIDMINAESAAALRAAYRLMDGSVSKRINGIADKILTLTSSLEAALDYPEEMEDEVLPSLYPELCAVSAQIDALLLSAKSGRMAKHGITAALAGETNAGKSSLMNALLMEERAIVTPIAGTTRDTVSESLECDGVKINLVDTAGIRDSDDIVENEGIRRAREAIRGADVVIHVVDSLTRERTEWDFGDKIVFTVYNKCDLTSFRCPRSAYTYAVSAKTGQGVADLAKGIASIYKEGKTEGGEIITSQRHIAALYRARTAIANAMQNQDATVDCTLIDLRGAYSALGEITGRTATEDIINDIFSRFCVGK